MSQVKSQQKVAKMIFKKKTNLKEVEKKNLLASMQELLNFFKLQTNN